METVGLRIRPEGCSQSPLYAIYDELETETYTDITESFDHEEIYQSYLNNFSRKHTESTLTYVTDLSEDFISQDSMATRKCFLTCSADTFNADSSLDLVIDRTCDFVASANSSRTSVDTAVDVSSDTDTQCVPECSVLTREVVGCEDPDYSVISQPEDSEVTVCPTSPEFSSTSTLCKNKTTSSKESQRESSKPLASSTMIDQFSHLSLSSDSIPVPCALSTMTGERSFTKPCKFQRTSDLHSIYTWSIYDKSKDTVFDESYVNGHYCIPELPNTKVLTSSPKPSSSKMYKCDTNKHVMPSECCRLPLMDSLSVIEPSDCLRDGHVDVESLYDEDIPVKSNVLPRTSTKVALCSVENFHQVPNSSDDSGEDDIVQERPEPDLPQPKSSKVFKFPKTTTQLKKFFTFRKSKGKNSDKAEPKHYTTGTHHQGSDNKKNRDVVQVRDRKAVIKKMKSFSASVNKEEGSDVQVLALFEQIKEVPTKVDNYLLTKHYLHATDLIVSAVAKLEGPLSGVAALRDLRSELTTRKEQLHEILIDELNKQIYNSVPNAQRAGYRRTDSLTKQGEYHSLERKKRAGQENSMVFPSVDVPEFGKNIKEDLNSSPEDNPAHFIAVLVESLFVLKKVPEAAEGLKIRIQPELSAIVARASQQVVDSSCQQGETLSQHSQPRYLMDLLEIIFQQFRLVAHMHKMVLRNLQRIFKSGVLIRGEQMYDIPDVWSKIQAVIELLLREYLDVQNTASSRQRAPSSFDEPSTDINQYFSKKKPSKQKKPALFRFDASIHAMSTNSYVEDSRAFDSADLFGASLLAEMGLEKHQMVCKPSVYNITAIFKPLQRFIKETEDAIACQDGGSSLQAFVTDFVQDIFLGQVHNHVSNSIGAATKVDEEDESFDSLRHVVDHKTQRDLCVSRPLLTSTVTVDKNIQELRELMHDLPDYADQFLNMVCNILQEYRNTCQNAYRGIVQYDSDEKRVISAMWAKDEDISRFLRSLPSWRTLQPLEGGKDLDRTVCSEEEMRALNSKEVNILISNLSSSDSMIPQQEIITDVTQMRTIANVHESLEWFSGRLGQFSQCLSAKSSQQKLVVDASSSEYPPVSRKAIDSLNMLVQDFQDLAEICLLLLHLEVRVHCFYFLLPVAKQSNYAGPIDDLDPDSNVLKLNKDLTSMEEVLSQSLQPNKFKYIFESLGLMVASILMNSIQFLKKINENGIKKMCRNLFAIQQNLTNITMLRENDLDHARQFYELLYLNPDDILTSIAEKGRQFTGTEYSQLIQLYHRSHPGGDVNQLEKRMQRLQEILARAQNGS